MRLACLIALLPCAPSFAQEFDINGYANVVVPRDQGVWFNSNAGLRKALRDAGFAVHQSIAELPRESWLKTLQMTTAVSDRLTFVVIIQDVATQTAIAACTRSVDAERPGHVSDRRSTTGLDAMGNELIYEIIEDLGYRGFDQAAFNANLQVQYRVLASKDQPRPEGASASPLKPTMSCRTDRPAGSETADPIR